MWRFENYVFALGAILYVQWDAKHPDKACVWMVSQHEPLVITGPQAQRFIAALNELFPDKLEAERTNKTPLVIMRGKLAPAPLIGG